MVLRIILVGVVELLVRGSVYLVICNSRVTISIIFNVGIILPFSSVLFIFP